MSYIIQGEIIYQVKGMSYQFDGYDIPEGLLMKFYIWFEIITHPNRIKST